MTEERNTLNTPHSASLRPPTNTDFQSATFTEMEIVFLIITDLGSAPETLTTTKKPAIVVLSGVVQAGGTTPAPLPISTAFTTRRTTHRSVRRVPTRVSPGERGMATRIR